MNFLSRYKLICFAHLSVSGFFIPAVRADVIIDWNAITVAATKKAGMNSNLSSRIEAIEAIAVYDAVNAIKHISTPYLYAERAGANASPVAAAATAAHDVLQHYFPAQRPAFDSALRAQLNEIKDQAGIPAGSKTGAAAAAAIIQKRATDHSDPDVSYPGPERPGLGAYRPTPGAFKPGIDQQWGRVTPFLLRTDSQYRPAPPPAPGTDSFNVALAQVEKIGSQHSSLRTEDQTHIAQFYKQDAELTVNETLRVLASGHPCPMEQNALIFLLTDIAEADARIAIWDAKYKFLFWRPVTALNADADGGVINNYSKWTPLISTPPHPSYPCGHCGTVTAGFEILKTFYGDSNVIMLHTATAGEPPRTIYSLSQGIGENDLSRNYGGIHYSFDIDASDHLGRQVAAWVLQQGPQRPRK